MAFLKVLRRCVLPCNSTVAFAVAPRRGLDEFFEKIDTDKKPVIGRQVHAISFAMVFCVLILNARAGMDCQRPQA